MVKDLHIPEYKEKGSQHIAGNIVIVSLVVTFIFGLLFGSASFGGLTGYDVYENFPVKEVGGSHPYLQRGTSNTEITIEPTSVVAGGPIYITVVPGPEGVRKDMKVYYCGKELTKPCNEGVLKTARVKLFRTRDVTSLQGTSFKITWPVTDLPYWTSSAWREGYYGVCVFDFTLNTWICEPFIVYRGNEVSEDLMRFDPSKYFNLQLS